MKAPNFTAENASEYGKRGQKIMRARLAERAKAQAEAQRTIDSLPASASEQARVSRVYAQIDLIDRLIDAAKGDADQVCKLMVAKDRAWNMVLPKAGVMRPRSSGRRGQAQGALPPPVDLPPA